MRYVILDNVRSSYNVGAIFRTADAAGVTKIFLTGYTPCPVDRFGRVVPEIEKTSLGASAMIPWESGTIESVIAMLRTSGVNIVAVEQSPASVSLYDFEPPTEVAYIFGNEVEGVSTETCRQADTIIEIPMAGQKESLNVSVTAGVVLLHHPYVV